LEHLHCCGGGVVVVVDKVQKEELVDALAFPKHHQVDSSVDSGQGAYQMDGAVVDAYVDDDYHHHEENDDDEYYHAHHVNSGCDHRDNYGVDDCCDDDVVQVQHFFASEICGHHLGEMAQF